MEGAFLDGRSPIRGKQIGCISQSNALVRSDFSLTRVTKCFGRNILYRRLLHQPGWNHFAAPQFPRDRQVAVAAGWFNGGSNVAAYTSSPTRR